MQYSLIQLKVAYNYSKEKGFENESFGHKFSIHLKRKEHILCSTKSDSLLFFLFYSSTIPFLFCLSTKWIQNHYWRCRFSFSSIFSEIGPPSKSCKKARKIQFFCVVVPNKSLVLSRAFM